ncbi:hypothetical protein AB0M28_06710 [Streptomyces sp. NPDC051940]|uniref:hypothetical protein n=1 Tax=Streptomyces sp. NPDC051940 TaxID=3155675 RepID=UPI00341A5468
MNQRRRVRVRAAWRQATAATGAALLAALTLGAAPAAAAESPEFDFDACPALAELPADADPGTWRCEVMHATGQLRIGRVTARISEPMEVVFAEGRVNGEFRQVFGRLSSPPIRVDGAPLTLTPRYAGYSDFQGNDERRGELAVSFGLRAGSLLPAGCAIGAPDGGILFTLKDTAPTRVISTNPLTVTFAAADTAFAAPGTTDCGRLTPALDAALGLPAPSGSNALELSATVGIRPYAR